MMAAIVLLFVALGGAGALAAFTLGDAPPFGLGDDETDPVPIEQGDEPDDPEASAEEEPQEGEALQDAEGDEGEATVTGTVLIDDEPAGEIRVTALGADGDEVASTRTEGDGTWSASLPAPETYDLVLDTGTLPEDAELAAGEEERRTVAVEEGETLRESWRLQAAPASPLTEAVTDRVAASLAVDTDEVTVECPDLDRYVAGELHACEIVDAPEPPATNDVLVSLHDADGEHVALPWEGPGDPPDLDEVIEETGGSGQFCRDVDDAGFGYQAAVAYWFHEGQPDRMDADRDGIPCGTIYSSEEIDAYWDAVRTLPPE